MNGEPRLRPGPQLAMSEPRGRWVLAATVLGSSLAMVDATVVNIALPAIGRDLDAGVAGLTWTINAYTLTLAALILVGGSLGDRLGRRTVFVTGVAVFCVASILCALAPGITTLVAARLLQGIGGALLTPGSLAIISASFRPEDRGRAIGAWTGLGGVAAAVGPLLGGWIVGVGSWRWIFLINVPVAVVVIAIAVRHVPESRDAGAARRADYLGAALAVLGLAGLTYGLTAWSEPSAAATGVVMGLGIGAAAIAGFVVRERVASEPMLPLGIFSVRAFTVTNIVTLLMYGALGGLFFWLVVTLQVVAGFSPVEAGLSLIPVTVLMLAFSERAGALAQRIGPRPLMTVGPMIAAGGVAALTQIGPDATYLVNVLGPVTLFGAGLTLTVTPLTTTALGSVSEERAGLASGVNNAVARTGGLLVVAVLPALTGLGQNGFQDPTVLAPAFRSAMLVCAALLGLGGLVAGVFLRAPRPTGGPGEPPAESCPRYHCAVDAAPLGSTPAR